MTAGPRASGKDVRNLGGGSPLLPWIEAAPAITLTAEVVQTAMMRAAGAPGGFRAKD